MFLITFLSFNQTTRGLQISSSSNVRRWNRGGTSQPKMSSHRKCDHTHLREFEKEQMRNSLKQIYIWRRLVIMLTGVFGGGVVKIWVLRSPLGLFWFLYNYKSWIIHFAAPGEGSQKTSIHFLTWPDFLFLDHREAGVHL